MDLVIYYMLFGDCRVESRDNIPCPKLLVFQPSWCI